ncbi:MAG: response regulator [Nitrospinae bacterium]|nr:response regulator [Nitrospinota bacterium]
MKAKILVADESPTIHKIVAMAFENEGIKVEGISKGEHVLEYMVDFQPDIVLADIHLPGVSGYELSRQIKGMDRFASVRVILLTSDFEDINQAEMDISRADDHISKPFKSDEIRAKVKSQLQVPPPEPKPEVREAVPAPEPEAAPEPEPAENEVIRDEFEGLLNQESESPADIVEELFPEEKELAAEVPQEIKAEASKMNQDAAEIMTKAPEEAFRADTRPVSVEDGVLNELFQSVIAAPDYGLKDADENAPQREPGSRPNLIEETLSLMARRNIKEELVTAEEAASGETLPEPADSGDNRVGHRVIAEHMEQVKARLPNDAMRGDVSATLEKTVRDLLSEIGPDIIRKVIQEEIEQIKKSEEA